MNKYLQIVVSAIAAAALFIGKDSTVFDWFVENKFISETANLKPWRVGLFTFGLIWSSLLVPILYYRLENKSKKREQIFLDLVKYHKTSFFDMIKKDLGEHNTVFKTRIFEPVNGVKGYIERAVKGTKTLKLVKVKGISDDFEHDTLTFKVYPDKQEGLVGVCYANNEMKVDLDLDDNKYHLTSVQKNKIKDVNFCSAIPIYTKDEKNIKSVLAVDSAKKINFDDEAKRLWANHLKVYAAFVDKNTKY